MGLFESDKRKAEKQQRKMIKSYYKAYNFGDTIYDDALEKHIIVLKKEYNGKFFIIAQNQYGRMLLQRFDCQNNVRLASVPQNEREYIQNKDIFDSWFKEAEIRIHANSKYYFDSLKVGARTEEFRNKKYVLAFKKDWNNKYYLIFRSEDNQYVMAKLVWFNDFTAVILSTEEFNENRRIFTWWVNEAKLQRK